MLSFSVIKIFLSELSRRRTRTRRARQEEEKKKVKIIIIKIKKKITDGWGNRNLNITTKLITTTIYYIVHLLSLQLGVGSETRDGLDKEKKTVQISCLWFRFTNSVYRFCKTKRKKINGKKSKRFLQLAETYSFLFVNRYFKVILRTASLIIIYSPFAEYGMSEGCEWSNWLEDFMHFLTGNDQQTDD